MLQVQQESINDLKKMITFLLEKLKKKLKSSRPGASSSRSKDKEKVGENSASKDTDGENNLNYEIFKSSKEQENLEIEEDRHTKRMNELENRL